MNTSHLLVVGAGLSGAVIARELADAGYRVTVADSRSHVAGNCHTERDPETGVMVHTYGPHIFHTDDDEVWAYVNRFVPFMPYVNRVKTTIGGQVFSLPINLHTINQFFGVAMGPDEAREFITRKAQKADSPARNFEEQALKMVGKELYEAFFKAYTMKQWGRRPDELPASILKRLPLRFNYDDNYFTHRLQGMPEGGYTKLVEVILDHPGITVRLNTLIARSDASGFDHIFWSGPLDSWFDHKLGRLGYRTLDFERFTYEGDFQGCAVMNYGDPDIPWTRITEHKHFSPWESHRGSVIYREFPRECGPQDIPYYPVRLASEKRILSEYLALARTEQRVTFVGRLGTYRYLDMDITIREALDTARLYLRRIRSGERVPVFASDI